MRKRRKWRNKLDKVQRKKKGGNEWKLKKRGISWTKSRGKVSKGRNNNNLTQEKEEETPITRRFSGVALT